MTRSPYNILIFEGKDMLVYRQAWSGHFLVIIPDHTFTCCKSIAMSYMLKAEPKKPSYTTIKMGMATGKHSTFAYHVLVFLLMFSLLYIVLEAIWCVTR